MEILNTTKTSNNSHLNRAKKLKDDEYYTPRDAVRKMVNRYRSFLKDKIIWLPFDSNDSEFVKYFKDNGKRICKLWFNTSDDFFKHVETQDIKNLNYKNELLIFGNPPFSIIKKITDKINNLNINYIFMSPTIARTNFLQEHLHSSYYIGSVEFLRPNKSLQEVKINIVNNFVYENYFILKNKKCEHKKEFIHYKKGDVSVDCFKKHKVYISITSRVISANWPGHYFDPRVNYKNIWTGNNFKYFLVNNEKMNLYIEDMIKNEKF